MTTYLELKQQAEKLMAEAEQLRRQEIEQVIAELKAKIKAYGLTARDLGLAQAASPRAAAPARKKAAASAKPATKGRGRAKSTAPAKYRGPNGETWSGGRGRKPRWVVQALAEGRKLEEFAVA
ncbi:H-NS histone family protein [Ramlibacter humi]|uniref:H-NS histone family protein n=1 Tax=Ramlibacter humi TaxID=2530451 RepID=A0A4Z0BX69_9BURK|nr:H-NS histone family protein [Ramlibacter humi]TFZ03843.1 H-NS histone family protein [Ramlibacter humi]